MAQSKKEETRTGNNFKPLDFNLVKEAFSLSRFCRDEGLNIQLGSRGSYVVCCPFHTEDTPSCHIFDDRRFICFGCGAKGTIIDFVLKLKSFLDDSPAAAAFYLIENQQNRRNEDYTFNSPPAPGSRSTATAPAVHRLKIDKREIPAARMQAAIAARDALFTPWFIKAREYAEQRGWLAAPPRVRSYLLGAMAAGEGTGFLSNEPSIAFPKLIQTRRAAEVFALEEEFEASGRLLCAGIKKRLLPGTISKWESLMQNQTGAKAEGNAPKWICEAGFITEIPWEFDCHEDAEVLVITKGPGDGLRLFNEANAGEEIHSRWGSRWHITAVDSARVWTLNSIPRRPVVLGSRNSSVSFFDGFKFVIILIGGGAGQNGAEHIVELAKRQNSSASIRNVPLPGNGDVCDFFDDGGKMSDLAELFRATHAV